MTSIAQLHPSWASHLQSEFSKPYIQQLKQFLVEEKSAGKVIYPKTGEIFNALNSAAFEDVRLVILGQDPYHGENQAHGLCFSVQKGVCLPPSLRNIFKEIEKDLGFPVPSHGCLQSWADQGVLLLNATLTVEQAIAGSHQGKGWEILTDKVIQQLSEQREGIVFLLWGSYAQKKGRLINEGKHKVLKAPHPSPLSAYRGFIGCGHFSTANQYLLESGQSAIDWQITE